MKTRPGFSGLLVLALLALAPLWARAEDQEGCLQCHGLFGFGWRDGDTYRSFEVDGAEYNPSLHGRIGCRGCHRDVVSIPHAGVATVNCGMDCHTSDRQTGKLYSHESLYWGFMASVHGKSAKSPITCRSCHPGNPPERSLPASPGERGAVCVGCHLDREVMARFGQRPAAVERYFRDIHGRLDAAGGAAAPTCTDCHTPHNVLPAERENSTIRPDKLAATCAGAAMKNEERSCHREAATARLVGMSPLPAVGWRHLPGGWLFFYPGLALAALLAVRMAAGGWRR